MGKTHSMIRRHDRDYGLIPCCPNPFGGVFDCPKGEGTSDLAASCAYYNEWTAECMNYDAHDHIRAMNRDAERKESGE